jgi:hypothetical protein
MRFTTAALIAFSSISGSLASTFLGQGSGVSQSTYDDLVRYTKYSSGAYQLVCLKPLGNTLVGSFDHVATDTQGFIARDDKRKEIVVAFRGTQQIFDFITDFAISLIPLHSPGVTNVEGAYAHAGFLTAYNSVAPHVISVVKSQLAAHPDYTIVSTGHSLGGSLASIASLSLKANLPANATVKLYTFGQPRTGNSVYASLVETALGDSNIFRAVHTFDGVPTMVPRVFGYHHHSTEYWQFAEPAEATHVQRCLGPEDPMCSDSIASKGIDVAHAVYFGQVMTVDPRVCF